MFNTTMQKLLATGAAVAATVATLPAYADATIPDGTSALSGLVTSQASYAPIMYGLAAAAVGIMIAIKWIKRGRGAA